MSDELDHILNNLASTKTTDTKLFQKIHDKFGNELKDFKLIKQPTKLINGSLIKYISLDTQTIGNGLFLTIKKEKGDVYIILKNYNKTFKINFFYYHIFQKAKLKKKTMLDKLVDLLGKHYDVDIQNNQIKKKIT